jgi:hypothetical protein
MFAKLRQRIPKMADPALFLDILICRIPGCCAGPRFGRVYKVGRVAAGTLKPAGRSGQVVRRGVQRLRHQASAQGTTHHLLPQTLHGQSHEQQRVVIMTDTEPTAAKPMKPSSRQVWIVILIVAAVAFGVLAAVWIVVNPIKDTLWYEVAKTSLQVLGVAVIGGIVTFATARFQQDRQSAERAREADRQRADKALEAVRQRAERELEKQREAFDRRAALLDPTSRCAQKMFVTC